MSGPNPAVTLDGLETIVTEVRASRALLEEAEAALKAEQAAHAATRKELQALRLREGKLKAKLEQKGPLDTEDEDWLKTRGAEIHLCRLPGKTPVRLKLSRRAWILAKTVDEAIGKARRLVGEVRS